ncbi:MAG: iron-sulfur cluster assembly scaffold protein [Candidatus Peribacteraceae bacterium]|nr:iron-sulfur cluster assembly scaffold protein [Candidatus Peribacteraceae bacterium]
MDLYADNILDHARHPHRKSPLPSPTVEHEERNASCGDTLTLQLTIEDGRVTDVGWAGDGCAISQAGMSLLSDELTGKTERELEALTKTDVLGLLGVDVGPRRLKCALLSLHALKNALHRWKKEPEQGWNETMG